MIRREGLIRWLVLAGLLLAWELFSRIAALPVLPPPARVLAVLWGHLVSGELPEHLGITLLRVGAAFTISLAVGAAIGIVMGRRTLIDQLFDGLLVLGLNIPALVTIILCYIWFGLTEAAAVTAVALNKIPTVAVTMREGARDLDTRLLQVADAFRLPAWRRFRRVFLPQLYPYLMASARSGLALIWKIVLVVELLGRSDGIGFQLGTFFHFFHIAGILAYTLAFASLIYLIEAFVMRPIDRVLAERRA